MSMFNYSRRMEASGEKKKAVEKQGPGKDMQLEEQAAVGVPAPSALSVVDFPLVPTEPSIAVESMAVENEPVADMPLLLRQYPADRIKASVHAGLLRVDFPDAESDTGSGFMLLRPGCVRQAVSGDGLPLPGKADVSLADGAGSYAYYIVKDGLPVKSERAPSSFVSEWEAVRRAAAESARNGTPGGVSPETGQKGSVMSYE